MRALLVFLLLAGLVFSGAVVAQENVAAVKPAAPKPDEIFDFETDVIGAEPENGFVLDGKVAVAEGTTPAGGKVLRLGPDPIVETSVQLGSSARGSQRIRARVRAEKKRRSSPRFAVGVHGISGYRLRVVPASKKIELVRNEEVVESKDFIWQSGATYHLEVDAQKSDNDSWEITARVWKDGEARPEKATFTAETDKMSGQGKAAVYATPYAGTPIDFDKVEISFK